MADKGIIFSAPMVRALLDGTKTQTRRLAKPRSTIRPSLLDGSWADSYVLDHGNAEWLARDLPYAPGDRLYVREAWSVRGEFTDVVEVGYRASENRGHTEYVEQIPVDKAVPGKGKWPAWPKYGPSIHMPRWASRITLTVTDVRVQRLQEISEDDAIAEGIEFVTETASGRFYRNHHNPECPLMAYGAYRSLWESLHGDGSWQANPWIVAVSFDVRRGNIDQNPPTNSDAGGDHVTRSAERANTFKPIDTGRPGNGRPTSTGQGAAE